MELLDLRKPFASSDIEWRITRSGVKQNGDVWALCTAYVTNRAIMDRLDDVCGQAGWFNQYAPGPGGGLLCGISIKVDSEWVTKWDGADNTQIEAVKGGLSGSMKRAAVQWGVGRYLYNVEEGYAKICPENGNGKGIYRGEAKKRDNTKVFFTWNPPKLPAWALPKEDDGKGAAPVTDDIPTAGSAAEDRPINKAQFDDIVGMCKKHEFDFGNILVRFGAAKGSDLMESQLNEIYDIILSAGKE